MTRRMSFRKLARRLAGVAVCLGLSACGTIVPNLREWPATDYGDEEVMIETIIRSVGCELSYTVTRVIEADRFSAERRVSKKRYADFLLDWGVEVALNLTVVERTGVNPSLLLTPLSAPASTFTVSGGLDGSAEASRLQKTNVFYSVRNLYRPEIFQRTGDQYKCRDLTGNKQGSLLVDNDLRLFSLLESRIGAVALNFTDGPDKSLNLDGEKNVLSQQVSFKIETSANLTPSWKLVRATVNPSGTFFSTGRDRTHELVFTFGPLDKSAKGQRRLVPYALQTHLNTQLQTTLMNLPFLNR